MDDISVSELAGFVLALKRGKNKKLVLIPVAHAWWFKQPWRTQFGSLAQNIPEGTLRDHDGPMTVSGAEAGAGASLKHRPGRLAGRPVPDHVRASIHAIVTLASRLDHRRPVPTCGPSSSLGMSGAVAETRGPWPVLPPPCS